MIKFSTEFSFQEWIDANAAFPLKFILIRIDSLKIR